MPLAIKYRPLDDLAAYDRNPRTHSPDQVRELARSLAAFGWAAPIAIADDTIIYGHGRRLAALALREAGTPIPNHPDPNVAPTVDLSHLTPEQRRAYRIADNQLALRAEWDDELLFGELGALEGADFDLSLLGFDADELAERMAIEPVGGDDAEAGTLLALTDITIPDPRHEVKAGDHWQLAQRHHLFCISVISDWPIWHQYLQRGALFVPYPGPFIPFGERASEFALIMVQPDAYTAGVLLDRYAEVHGEDAVERISRAL